MAQRTNGFHMPESRLAKIENCMGRLDEQVKAIEKSRTEWKVEVERRMDEANGHLKKQDNDREHLVSKETYSAGHTALEGRLDREVRELSMATSGLSRELSTGIIQIGREMNVAVKNAVDRAEAAMMAHNREDAEYHDKTDRRLVALEESRSEGMGVKEQSAQSVKNTKWIIGIVIGLGFSLIGTGISFTMLAVVIFKLFSRTP